MQNHPEKFRTAPFSATGPIRALTLLLGALVLSSCASPELRLARKEGPKLKKEIPGGFSRQRYAIVDPTYDNHDVIKIAYLRESITRSDLNPFKGLFPLLGLLPIPVWNNGDFVYSARKQSGAKRTVYVSPDDLLEDRLVTVVIENPADLSDYDIVVRQRYTEGTREVRKRFMWTFLFYYDKADFPRSEISATSEFGLNFTINLEARRFRYFHFALIPLWYSNSKDAEVSIFVHRLYKQLVETGQDTKGIVRDRKRRYIFGKDPKLKDLEDFLRTEAATLRPEARNALLRNYKLRFDFVEHRRVLEELADLSEIRTLFDTEIGNRQAAAQNDAKIAAQLGDISRMKNAFFSGRLDPAISPLDVRFGRNYDLYGAELLPYLQDGPVGVRQYSIRQLREFANNLEGASGYARSSTRYLQTLAQSKPYSLPPAYARFALTD